MWCRSILCVGVLMLGAGVHSVWAQFRDPLPLWEWTPPTRGHSLCVHFLEPDFDALHREGYEKSNFVRPVAFYDVSTCVAMLWSEAVGEAYFQSTDQENTYRLIVYADNQGYRKTCDTMIVYMMTRFPTLTKRSGLTLQIAEVPAYLKDLINGASYTEKTNLLECKR